MAKRFVCFCVAAFLLFISADTCLAVLKSDDLPRREGMKMGDFLFHAAVKTSTQYDSNIYLTKDDTKQDFIFLINPSVGIEIPMRENTLSASYDIGINMFERYDRNNHIDHRAQVLAEIKMTDYKIDISDTWRRFTDRAGSEDTNRIRQMTNNFKVGLSTEMDQLAMSLSYANKINDYISKDIITDGMTYSDKDSMTHIGDLELSYRFLPKTWALVEGTVGYIDYYKSSLPPNAYYAEGLVGLKGAWFDKMVINLRAGAKHQHYESSSVVITDDFTGFIARGGFDYNITNRDVFSFNCERNIYESTYQNINYYEVNMLGLKYAHHFNKVIASVFGSYQINNYPEQTTEDGVTATRRDYLYKAGASLRYDVQKWMSLEAKYEFKKRESKFSKFNYNDHLATVTGTVGF